MSKSKIMKQNAEPSQEVGAYALRKVTATLSSSPFSHAGSIGGSASEIEQESYIRGFTSGEQAGKEQGLKEVEAKYHFLTEMIEKLKSVEQDLIKSTESDVLQLALAIAKRIIRQEIHHNPERIQDYIREAMEKMNQSDKFLIRVHPEDKSTLSKTGSQIIQTTNGMKSIRLEADPNLQPGECIIESHARMVDGRIDSQLALFGEAFFKSLEKE